MNIKNLNGHLRIIRNVLISSIVIVFFGFSSIINGVNAASEKKHHKNKRHTKITHNDRTNDFVKPKRLNTDKNVSLNYTIENLSLIYDSSAGNELDHKAAVGWSYKAPQMCSNSSEYCIYPVPVIFENGKVTNLVPSLPNAFGVANSINSGLIVGYLNDGRYNSPYFAFLSDGAGNITKLPSLGGDSEARSINKYGQAVGLSLDQDNIYHAVLWENEKLTDLGTLQGFSGSYATHINDNGEIAINALDDNFNSNAYKIKLSQKDSKKKSSDTQPTITLFQNLDPDLNYSQVLDINNNGIAVGVSFVNEYGFNRAVSWDKDGKISELNLPQDESSSAIGINDDGLIIGIDNEEKGFLYVNDNYYDLLTLLPLDSGWSELTPKDINDHGDIVGTGLYKGKRMAFKMTLK